MSNPAVTVEMKVLEKRIIQEGVVIGHNEFWRPGKRWETLLDEDGKKTYKQLDFNLLVTVGAIPDDANADGEI